MDQNTQSDIPYQNASIKKTNFLSKYDLKQKLGQGAYSVVHLCTDKSTNAEYAVKIINTSSMLEREKAKIDKEIRINRDVRSKNIGNI